MDADRASVQPPEGGYPIQLGVTTDRQMSRWWGIPILGVAVRGFLSIPHIVVLQVLGIANTIWLLFGWIYILAYGRVPAVYVRLATEIMQRQARVLGYAFLMMPSEYPPLEPGPSRPINVQFHPDTLEINRWWGVPIANWIVRYFMLLAHFFIMVAMWIVAILMWLVVWIPVLLFGRYPDWAASFYGTTLRYTVRVIAYFFFLPVPYPPIWPD